MTDEAGILLRVSVFGFVTGVVYWFLSYEALGTVALLLLGAGPGFAGLILVLEQRHRGGGSESRGDALRRFAGIPRRDPPSPRDLEAEDLGVLPLPSIWPFACSLGLAGRRQPREPLRPGRVRRRRPRRRAARLPLTQRGP